jgi:serine/threonine protein kinase
MPAERVRGGLDWFAEAGYQAQRLTSPAVPGVLSYRSAGDFAFVATDVPAGTPIRDWVAAHGPFPVARAMRISSIVASVLAQAHAAGWAHGWISPETVWIGEGDVVSVTDLGLGLAAQPLTPGAAPYPAPGGFIASDPMRRDMQCLGLLLTMMLTGRLPDPVGVPRGDVFPDDLPGGVVRRIRTLINPQSERPPTAAEWASFAHVGESGEYTEPEAAEAPAGPDTAYYETSLPAASERPRLGTSLVTLALILIAGAATWFLYGGSQTGTPAPLKTPATSAAPAPDTLTKVQVGPVRPADVEETSRKLARMGFEPFPKREGGEIYLQVGAFANPDGAKQAESELKAAGLPTRVQ